MKVYLPDFCDFTKMSSESRSHQQNMWIGGRVRECKQNAKIALRSQEKEIYGSYSGSRRRCACYKCCIRGNKSLVTHQRGNGEKEVKMGGELKNSSEKTF